MKNLIAFFIILFSNSLFGQSIFDSILLGGINKYRAELGLSELQFCHNANEIAVDHANYLCQQNKTLVGIKYITHDRTDTTSLEYRIRAAYFNTFTNSSEVCGFINLNVNTTEDETENLHKMANAILETYRKSPNHYKQLLNPDFKYVGIGYVTVQRPTNVVRWLNINIYSTFVFS